MCPQFVRTCNFKIVYLNYKILYVIVWQECCTAGAFSLIKMVKFVCVCVCVRLWDHKCTLTHMESEWMSMVVIKWLHDNMAHGNHLLCISLTPLLTNTP